MALEPPSLRFEEIECAKKHGGWAAWQTFSEQVKGELMAHEHEANMRAAYDVEMRNPAKKKPDEVKGGDPFARIQRAFNKKSLK